MEYFNVQIISKELTLKSWLENTHLAKAKINYLLNNQCCFVNGLVASNDTLLNNNDSLMIDLSFFEKHMESSYQYQLEVLYEDDYLLIINKPSGFIIYPDGINNNKTIANIVSNYYEQKGESHGIYHVHRLDEDTTGCLVFAKDIITLAYLSNSFATKEVKKHYLAIVNGTIYEDGVINSPIGSDRHNNNKMVITKNGKLAKTLYKVIKINHNKTLLNVTITSGRTHQIRVHLSSIGYPIVGDQKYGDKNKVSRVMLHCYEISFIHPYTKEEIVVKSEEPKDMQKLVY